MYTTKCLIQFVTHAAHIQVKPNGTITVFKHNDRSCDFQVFAGEDNLAASDYIIYELPTTYYRVTVTGDDEEQI